MNFQYHDGGRNDAGYKGSAGDCVTRAIAIATGLPYQIVYGTLNELAKRERTGKRKRSTSSSRKGVYKTTYHKYLLALGWTWTPTMEIGSGCKVHLRADELPDGRLIVSVSRHLVAVINGTINDTHDCSRNGSRCVYGYYTAPTTTKSDKLNIAAKAATEAAEAAFNGKGWVKAPAQCKVCTDLIRGETHDLTMAILDVWNVAYLQKLAELQSKQFGE
jgi:hypothetical protein